ncbi:doublecortin domain-containing protein 2B [Tiliqua scincoides]|uniref:doublecortin domain-containing protein 2B n=1 Tax=Tiliqua scincoides TaxID=71010 RepID=UPI0034635266
MSCGTVTLAPPAKNVVLYRNGDPFFHGRKFVVSSRRLLTFEAFLNEVTSTVQAPVAVRSIYTPRQGHQVTGLGELQNGGQYVAAGFERFRRIDKRSEKCYHQFCLGERKSPASRSLAELGISSQPSRPDPTCLSLSFLLSSYLNPGMKPFHGHKNTEGLQKHPVISRRASVLERWTRQVNVPFFIHVFRNGDLLSPAFRLVLTKSLLQEWSTVLRLLSEKANLRNGAVRKLCKLNGEIVSSGEDLVSGHYYVAVGLEKYRSLPYFELLVPKKTTQRLLRNLPIKRRQNYGQGFGKVRLASQDGASDSLLLEPLPRVDRRRVQSTGTAEKENRPTSPPARPKPAGKHPHRDEGKSMFHARPVQVGPVNPSSHQGADEEGSVYRTKGARREMQGAQEVGEDEDTQVDLPIDQKTAETVEDEEVAPRIKLLPHSKFLKFAVADRLQKTSPVPHSAGDAGDDATRWPHFLLARTSLAESATSPVKQSPSEAPPGGERS